MLNDLVPVAMKQEKGLPKLIRDFFDDMFKREELPVSPYPDLVQRFRIAESAEGESIYLLWYIYQVPVRVPGRLCQQTRLLCEPTASKPDNRPYPPRDKEFRRQALNYYLLLALFEFSCVCG